MFIRTGAFQVQPTYSFIPADMPQASTTKHKAKKLKAKTKSKELVVASAPLAAESTIATENDEYCNDEERNDSPEDRNDEDPVVLKVR